eukprot:evm.model.scf_2809.2 EVM.evm.TU.scf_2809.2   scf_2809:10118-15886(-)
MDKPLTSLKDYRPLGKSGLRVSPLCLGTMTFGTKWERLMGECSREAAENMFNTYVDEGGNFIDTANKYQEGETEEWLGDFVQRHGGRDELVIASKYSLPLPMGNVNFAGNHRKSMFQALEASLKRLRTHYIDVYYVHFWDHSTPEVEIMRGLDDLVRSGKVMYVGVSDTPAWEVARCNTLAEHFGWTPFISYQGRHNIGDRSMEREIVPMCRRLGLGVCPWSVLGAGKYTGRHQKPDLDAASASGRKGVKMGDRDYNIVEEVLSIAEQTNRTPTQVVLNWELQQPGICAPILGLRKMSHLIDNLKAMEFTLTAEHIDRLNKVAKFDLGFPLDFIGTSYETCPWVNWQVPEAE